MAAIDASKADLRLQRIAFATLIALAVIATIVFGVVGYNDTNEIISRLYVQQAQYTPEIVTHAGGYDGANNSTLSAVLEVDAINARNMRALSALATTTWLRFVTVMFGAILMVLGGALVLARVTSDSIQVSVEAGAAKGGFGTTSPGLVMVLLGALLIGWGLYVSDRTSVAEGALFGSFLNGGTNTPSKGASIAPVVSDEDIARILRENGFDLGE